jgi:hypothetical protein
MNAGLRWGNVKGIYHLKLNNNNIKMDLKEVAWKVLDSIYRVYGPLTYCYAL